jgi:hypothetical protein
MLVGDWNWAQAATWQDRARHAAILAIAALSADDDFQGVTTLYLDHGL